MPDKGETGERMHATPQAPPDGCLHSLLCAFWDASEDKPRETCAVTRHSGDVELLTQVHFLVGDHNTGTDVHLIHESLVRRGEKPLLNHLAHLLAQVCAQVDVIPAIEYFDLFEDERSKLLIDLIGESADLLGIGCLDKDDRLSCWRTIVMTNDREVVLGEQPRKLTDIHVPTRKRVENDSALDASHLSHRLRCCKIIR